MLTSASQKGMTEGITWSSTTSHYSEAGDDAHPNNFTEEQGAGEEIGFIIARSKCYKTLSQLTSTSGRSSQESLACLLSLPVNNSSITIAPSQRSNQNQVREQKENRGGERGKEGVEPVGSAWMLSSITPLPVGTSGIS